jgi:hypothetical protein
MEELNEIESKKLDEYTVKTVHEDGRIDVNVDMKRMIDDLLGGNNKTTEKIENKIIRVTFVKPKALLDPFGRAEETSIYLINKTREEIIKLFEDILNYEDTNKGDPNSNVKMSLRAYVLEEGKPYNEFIERNLTSIKGAELIDGRNTARI